MEREARARDAGGVAGGSPSSREEGTPRTVEIAGGAPSTSKFDFQTSLNAHNIQLHPLGIDTLQVNLTKLCNQACRHCHVDASPYRTEQMDRATVDKCLEVLASNPSIRNLDLTGGAPELNPHFEYMVAKASELGVRIMVRHNLTVTIDGNPRTGEAKRHLPEFFARYGIEVISSLPYYQEYFTDKQRGKGVFEKSLASLRLLNDQGYGSEESGLVLDLVYNPVGAFLPARQEELEADFKRELRAKHGIRFNRLFTMTNMPIHRFREQLEHLGAYDEYMMKLVNAFNPAAAEGVMCRSLLSIGYDGRIFDCDFNQMLEMHVELPGPATIFNFDMERLLSRSIRVASHCFGCTAGSGSSCGGSVV